MILFYSCSHVSEAYTWSRVVSAKCIVSCFDLAALVSCGLLCTGDSVRWSGKLLSLLLGGPIALCRPPGLGGMLSWASGFFQEGSSNEVSWPTLQWNKVSNGRLHPFFFKDDFMDQSPVLYFWLFGTKKGGRELWECFEFYFFLSYVSFPLQLYFFLSNTTMS